MQKESVESPLIGRFTNGCMVFFAAPEHHIDCLRTSESTHITESFLNAPSSYIGCNIYGVKDSISGIFEAIRLAAVNSAVGDFRCLDFSWVRGVGTRVEDTGGIASGPVSFARVWDQGADNSNAIIKGIAILKSDHQDIQLWKDYKSKNLLIGWYD